MANHAVFLQGCKISLLALTLSVGAFSSKNALAHGYVAVPESRAYACKTGSNTQCGAIQWEPQSAEGLSGFPQRGPVDGTIASAGNRAFSPLDEQTPSRWSKTQIKSGWNKFTWQFTANHVTRNWRYYLTQQNWDQNKPLSRASFDTAPFCVIDGSMVQPPKRVTHDCYVPEGRTGYQVVLAVWEIGDTVNSFYNVIDVNFSAGSSGGGEIMPLPWQEVGAINPSLDLKAGDKVMTRVFDANGEQAGLQTVITITDAAQGAKQNWPFLLASAINTEQTQLNAGQKNAADQIKPIYGKNTIFAAPNSGIERVEVGFELAPEPEIANQLTVSGLKDDYSIEDGIANIHFDVNTNSDLQVSAYLFNHSGEAAGFVSQAVNNSSASLALAVVNPTAGHYHLHVKAQSTQGDIIQQNYDVFLKNPQPVTGAEFVFPAGLTSYKAGTVVLQPKTGKTYQCKPWPYNGYCVQWSTSATSFEPGVGAAWMMAWIER